MTEELEEACGEAGCAYGVNDGAGGGIGGIFDVGSYVNGRYMEEAFVSESMPGMLS